MQQAGRPSGLHAATLKTTRPSASSSFQDFLQPPVRGGGHRTRPEKGRFVQVQRLEKRRGTSQIHRGRTGSSHSAPHVEGEGQDLLDSCHSEGSRLLQ